MIAETGPYLKVAVFCENAIEGKDGVLSLIRVIDRITITAAGPETPDAMPSIPLKLKLVLMLVSGKAHGTHEVELRIEKPDGSLDQIWTGTVFLEGEDRGANIIIDVGLESKAQGLHWFHVAFDGQLLTKLPFRLIYQYQRA